MQLPSDTSFPLPPCLAFFSNVKQEPGRGILTLVHRKQLRAAPDLSAGVAALGVDFSAPSFAFALLGVALRRDAGRGTPLLLPLAGCGVLLAAEPRLLAYAISQFISSHVQEETMYHGTLS